MQRRGFLTFLGAAALAGCAPEPREMTRDDFDALGEGGHVIVFRQAATRSVGIDQPDWPLEDQNALSQVGILQSQAIGAGIQRRGIPIGEVRTSPFIRSQDMARIAFGRGQVDEGLLSAANQLETVNQRINYLRGILSTENTSPFNTVLVTHGRNVILATGVALEPGQAAVFKPIGNGAAGVVGTLRPEEW